MHLAELHFYSTTLGRQTALNVLLPENCAPPFATLYLLHGLSDDHTSWLRRSRLEVYAERHHLAIVLPNGDRGFYTNHEDGPAYADYIAEEVTNLAERCFPLRRDRGGRCIGGLSMGGYGALRLALSLPHRYVSAHSHSGAVLYTRRGLDNHGVLTAPEFHKIFGAPRSGTSHDLLHLASQLKPEGDRPRLSIDCGRDDFLFEQNKLLHAGLEALGVSHDYQVFPGAHTWDYWDTHIQHALAFHEASIQPLTPA